MSVVFIENRKINLYSKIFSLQTVFLVVILLFAWPALQRVSLTDSTDNLSMGPSLGWSDKTCLGQKAIKQMKPSEDLVLYCHNKSFTNLKILPYNTDL